MPSTAPTVRDPSAGSSRTDAFACTTRTLWTCTRASAWARQLLSCDDPWSGGKLKHEIAHIYLREVRRRYRRFVADDIARLGVLAVHRKTARGGGKTVASIRQQKTMRGRPQEGRGGLEEGLPGPFSTGRKLRRIPLRPDLLRFGLYLRDISPIIGECDFSALAANHGRR